MYVFQLEFNFKKDIVSHTNFQMFVYYSILFYPFFMIGEILTIFWKLLNFRLSAWHMFMNVGFAAIFILVEPLRLSLAFKGNIKEIVSKLYPKLNI